MAEESASGQRSVRSATRRLTVGVLFLAVSALLVLVAIGRWGEGVVAALISPWLFQQMLLFGIALVAAMLLRGWRTAALAAAGLAWTGGVLLPHLRVIEPPAQRGPPIRLLHANVLAWHAPEQRALDWIASVEADVIVIVECSNAWADAMLTLHARYPFRFIRSEPNPSGIAIYSKFPLSDTSLSRAPDGSLPFIRTVLHAPGGDVLMYSIHTAAPTKPKLVASRNAELAWLAEQVRGASIPVIVDGDFNESPYGRAYNAFVTVSGLRPARMGFGRTPTWPAGNTRITIPEIFRTPIDHCFTSAELEATSFRVGPDIGSDHLPLVVELQLAP